MPLIYCLCHLITLCFSGLRFCIALAKPSRRKRLKEAFKHIDREQRVKRGDVVPFIHLQEKVSSLQTHRQGTEGEERRRGSLHSSTGEGKQPSNT